MRNSRSVPDGIGRRATPSNVNFRDFLAIRRRCAEGRASPRADTQVSPAQYLNAAASGLFVEWEFVAKNPPKTTVSIDAKIEVRIVPKAAYGPTGKGLVTVLIPGGVVTRTRDKQDERVVRLARSEAGHQLVETAPGCVFSEILKTTQMVQATLKALAGQLAALPQTRPNGNGDGWRAVTPHRFWVFTDYNNIS